MQEVLCLLRHHYHCCVIHMLVQISRQGRKNWVWKTQNIPPPCPAFIAAVPLSKVLKLDVMTFSVTYINF